MAADVTQGAFLPSSVEISLKGTRRFLEAERPAIRYVNVAESERHWAGGLAALPP
jgi:hypothetical protein